MQEIIQFVSTSIASGIVGNTVYDSLKVILGSSFNKLSEYLSINQKEKFNSERVRNTTRRWRNLVKR